MNFKIEIKIISNLKSSVEYMPQRLEERVIHALEIETQAKEDHALVKLDRG